MISKLSLNLDTFSRAHYFKLIRRNSPSSPLQRSSSSRKRELQRRRRKKKKKKRNSPLSLYGLKVARGGAAIDVHSLLAGRSTVG